MKYKILAVLTIILISSGGISAYEENSDQNQNTQLLTQKEEYNFSNPLYKSNNEYLSVEISETDSFLMEPGRPMLPMFVKTFTFPFGTKIKNVKCTALNIINETIDGKIIPSPTPKSMSSLSTEKEQIIEDTTIYSSSEIYPKKPYEYTIHYGLKNNNNSVIVNLYSYIFRYSPEKNTIYQTKKIDINIEYELPCKSQETKDKHDLVIITPRKFSSRLQPLIDHKENIGLNTTLKTTESIYKEARQGRYISKGRDRAEKIKLFIHWAKENWDITYVLLVGGKATQSLLRWHVPVRYTNLDDYSSWEQSYLSDLYFADIYKYNTESKSNDFEDWDSNNNNVFAEWYYKSVFNWSSMEWERELKKDVLDLYPDVYLGRLTCRNRYHVTDVVNKIIYYENNTYGKKWFNDVILVGGDTIPPADYGKYGVYEGEIGTNLSAKYLKPLGFNFTKLWVSKGTLTGTNDVIREFSKGASFVHFSGHGTPKEWSTHPADAEENGSWIDGLFLSEMKYLENKNKYPIVIVGGCHNSQFDVCLMNLLTGILRYRFRYFVWSWDRDTFLKWEWVPYCWSEHLLTQKDGGSIATIGNTGLGYEYFNEECINGLSPWLETHFFKLYAEYEPVNQTLGRIHSDTLSDYATKFNPNNRFNYTDRKTVEQWALFGDPSLRIGGIPK